MTNFPISGPLREILLGFEWIIVFFCFQFVLLFAIKLYFRSTKKKELQEIFHYEKKALAAQFDQYLLLLKIREFAWGFLFLLLGLTYLMFIIADYFAGDAKTRLFFLYAGYLFFLIGMTTLSFSLERNEIRTHNYVFSKIFLDLELGNISRDIYAGFNFDAAVIQMGSQWGQLNLSIFSGKVRSSGRRTALGPWL